VQKLTYFASIVKYASKGDHCGIDASDIYNTNLIFLSKSIFRFNCM